MHAFRWFHRHEDHLRDSADGCDVCALRKGPSRKSLLRMMRLASTLECALGQKLVRSRQCRPGAAVAKSAGRDVTSTIG